MIERKEIARKLFHGVGFIYIAILVYFPAPMAQKILGAITAVAFVVDYVRLKVPALREPWFLFFGALLRTKEKNGLTGTPWMALGAFFTTVILPSKRLQAVCLLYLLLGDTAASLLGPHFGGPYWRSSDKRVSGSASCLLVNIIAGAFVLWPTFGVTGILGGAVVATVAEASGAKLNDNFLIPFLSAIFFRLLYF